MDLHHSTSGGEPSDPDSEEEENSRVSLKSDQSMDIPLAFGSGGREPSRVSLKSDQSMDIPLAFSSGGREPSRVSLKSDQSMDIPLAFSSGGREPSRVSLKSDQSMDIPLAFSSGGREPSRVSLKSDQSMDIPLAFGSGGREPSRVSLKSDQSMDIPLAFGSGGREPSRVSLKSDQSMDIPLAFGSGGREPSCVSLKSDQSMDIPLAFGSGPVLSHPWQHFTEATLHTHSLMGGTELLHQAPATDDALQSISRRHKTSMKKKYDSLFEGSIREENKTLLNRIYTQLYIIEGESEGVNEEHEVVQMERTQKKHLPSTPINCLHIFKPRTEMEEEKFRAVKSKSHEDNQLKVPKLRTVLTQGIAGIGKTVSVQKFILDWAEEKANQDVDFMFVLSFREINLIKDNQYSLHELLRDFYCKLKDLDLKIYDESKILFIFDGLDESRIPLNFEECEKVSDITTKTSVGVLMTNLIRGDLLPSALIWITSRPAAANQIPPQYVNRVTEIQGFSDPQKEEYFRKQISDQDQAQTIISHIKTVRSLHIMCHIPVFCWISATVLQQIMKHQNTEIPKTLTEMYSHFLLTQTNMKNEKYEEKDERDPEKLLESNRTVLLKLAKLAFRQLIKGNVMFYEEDLRESSIDVTEAAVYSGIFTEIFREECMLHQRKVYCFVHLSFQEFLAAVYVYHCYESNYRDELQFLDLPYGWWSKRVPLDELLIGAVDKAVENQNGHLDLFLRFLLGISLESNQRLLQGLLTPTLSSLEGPRDYINKLIKEDDVKKQRAINLYLCLSEIRDNSLCRELQEYCFRASDKVSKKELSPGQCSALACILLVSGEELDELDLKKYNTSEQGYKRLIPAVTSCRKAQLAGCYLTMDSCKTICSVLQSVNSSLKFLDLSNNDLQDSGVELLCPGLQSLHCKLERLRLAGCNLTTKSCETLCSVLQSVYSSLKELDLSNNDLQDSGVELLSTGLKSSHCKLEILRLANCNLREKACEDLGSVLQVANSSLIELDLSNNNLQDTGVKLLSAVYSVMNVKSSHCKLEIIRLSGCMVSGEGCSSLASALKSTLSRVRQLDLTYNHPGESGVKLLSDLLEDPHCTLEILQVEQGGRIRMKPGLQKYSCDLTLDLNTANEFLFLSEKNRKVECINKKQPYPDHPDRFTKCLQVLSVESLTGRCYWEAECSGVVTVAVAYKSMKRKENVDESGFGRNNQSWSLYRYNNGYCVRHNKKETVVSIPPSSSSRVGVYLDWGSGTLTFYRVSPDTDTLTPLHTFTTTFTEPLCAGFGVYYDSTLYICKT